LVLALIAALVFSACGSSKKKSAAATQPAGKKTAVSGQTVTNLQGTAPDYLDPHLGYTTQAAEPDWLSYLGLVSYAHANGAAGTKVIPALAAALPKISADGKTYKFTLRTGLVYSNGAQVKASDFAYSIQRAIKLGWGGKSFFTGNIVGADAYAKGSASSISGITSDDAAGTITIKLPAPYGAFLNVVAFPAAGFVPSGTPISNQSNTPPPGVGPYKIVNVVPNQSYDTVINDKYTPIPGIPAGHVSVTTKISSNTQTEAESVLNNSADAFDWADTLPPALLAQVKSQAKDRYVKEPTVSTFYFFLNTKTKPFNNLLARQAVTMAIDRRALSRIDSGNLAPACYFLPTGMIGHPTSPCPYGNPNAAPNLAKAKALVQQSGMAGAPVTVWSETRSPRKEYIAYYTDVLNKIGFKATTKVLADAQYFPTIGNLKLNPQTGFADWNQDYPNPGDFYLLLDATSIQPTNNQNFSQVSDPHIQSELAVLNKVPASQLNSVASRWEALDTYVAQKAYVAVYGYNLSPQFFSNRLDFGSAVFHPVYFNDYTSWKLK
jgi:peptide/nickel transport system substrate-binding protein